MLGVGTPWAPDFYPEWVWHLMTNLGLLAALIAVWASIVWVFNRGPKLLIEHGFDWMTKLGHRWQARRDR